MEPVASPPPTMRPETREDLLDELGADTLREVGPTTPRLAEARRRKKAEEEARKAEEIRRKAEELHHVVLPARLPEPQHVALEMGAEDLPHRGVQPRQVDPTAFRFPAHPMADQGGVTAHGLRTYFEAAFQADRANSQARSRSARPSTPMMSLGGRFTSLMHNMVASAFTPRGGGPCSSRSTSSTPRGGVPPGVRV